VTTNRIDNRLNDADGASSVGRGRRRLLGRLRCLSSEAKMPNHDPERVDHIIQQGRALVRAIEALGTIEPSGLFERLIAGLQLAAYKRRLRGIVEAAPAWMTERILSASERIDDRRMALWMSDN
jgi:hypothetical protein